MLSPDALHAEGLLPIETNQPEALTPPLVYVPVMITIPMMAGGPTTRLRPLLPPPQIITPLASYQHPNDT